MSQALGKPSQHFFYCIVHDVDHHIYSILMIIIFVLRFCPTFLKKHGAGQALHYSTYLEDLWCSAVGNGKFPVRHLL